MSQNQDNTMVISSEKEGATLAEGTGTISKDRKCFDP